MMLRANSLKHLAKVDRATLSDIVEVLHEPAVSGAASYIEQMAEEGPLRIELARGAERPQMILGLDDVHS